METQTNGAVSKLFVFINDRSKIITYESKIITDESKGLGLSFLDLVRHQFCKKGPDQCLQDNF